MTRRILHLSADVKAGDRVTVEYAYTPVPASPAPDVPPWWQEDGQDPSLGNPAGWYPTSASVELAWWHKDYQHPLEPWNHAGGAIPHVTFSDGLQHGAIIVVWHWPVVPKEATDPQGDTTSIDVDEGAKVFPADPDYLGIRWKVAEDIGVDDGGFLVAEHTVLANVVNTSLASLYVEYSTYSGWWPTVLVPEILGVQIGGGVIGQTNGSLGQFWIGQQIRTAADPADPAGVVEPYLGLG